MATLSRLLEQLGRAWRATAIQLREMPPDGSPARREDALLATAHPQWGAHEATNAGLDAIAHVDAAARHLTGVKSLVDTRNLILTPWPAARAVVESVAHAGWLLDPDVSADERVARRWMGRLSDAYRLHRYAKASGHPKSATTKSRKARESVVAELTRRFPGADTEWDLGGEPRPPWTVVGQTFPSLGLSSRRFAEFAGVRGVPGLYDLLSLMAHPNLAVLGSVLQREERDGGVEFTYRVEADEVERLPRLAALFLYRAGMVVSSYFGLDDQALESWADEASQAWGQVLDEPAAAT